MVACDNVDPELHYYTMALNIRNPEAERAFRHIAKLTNGVHCRFDSSSPQQLRDLLGAVAAYAAGGRRALADLSQRSSPEVRLLASQVR